ncbi:HeH/LEM domain-containing protein [Providencia vermicola]|uniref:HeH/LEM domain-containing protein n=1 Tax=Providencia vermicola TaxID=333965 RepID=UPI0032DB0333
MKVIYTKNIGRERGVCYRSQFLGVIHDATEVIIDGEFEDAEQAYLEAGIRVSFVVQDDLSTKTADELKALLTEKGIEFDAKAKKADLLTLLQE